MSRPRLRFIINIGSFIAAAGTLCSSFGAGSSQSGEAHHDFGWLCGTSCDRYHSPPCPSPPDIAVLLFCSPSDFVK